MIHQIGLDGKYSIVTVSEEAYKQICLIVALGMVCGKCGRPYDEHFPIVAYNLCLECFQKKHSSKKLTYVGLFSKDDRGYETHSFIDPNGYIYLSGTSSEHDPYESNYETLKYWSFPVPSKIVRDEKEIELSTWHWKIYGDLRNNSVLFIEYDPRYGGEPTVAFLTARYGETEEFNRRKGKHRKLYNEAKAIIEASKDKNGYYHVKEHTFSGMYSYYIYGGIADLASAENDRKEGLSKA